MAKEHGFRFVIIDADAHQQEAAQLGIEGLPTVIVFQDSRLIDGVSGPKATVSELPAWLAGVLAECKDGRG